MTADRSAPAWIEKVDDVSKGSAVVTVRKTSGRRVEYLVSTKLPSKVESTKKAQASASEKLRVTAI
jgi:hypothetical protein